MQDLIFDVSEGIATLTMNRPDARNALSAAMKDGLQEAFARINADPEIRAAILSGAAGCFSGGGDIRGMRERLNSVTVEDGRERMRDLHPLLKSMIELDKPLIAAVDGAAFGAGFSMACVADFVLVSPRARFCMSFLRIGLIPDFGAMYTLPRLVGVQRAKELMISAREVSADEAVRLGIALEVVAQENLMARARELAGSFRQASAMAVSLIKRDVTMALGTDLQTLLVNEADHQSLCFQTSAHKTAVQRFLDKQPTAFQFPARR